MIYRRTITALRTHACCYMRRPTESLGPPFHCMIPRRAGAQTKLPSREKAKRIGQKDASAREAGPAVRSPRSSRRKRGGENTSSVSQFPRFGVRGRDLRVNPLSAAAAREERAGRLRRDRAAAQTVRSAFPSVQQLRLDMEFEGAGARANIPTAQSHVLHPPARAYFTFACPYADCDGQFDLTEAVNAALADRSRQAEGASQCSGARVGTRASRQPCLLRLVHRITAIYHQGS
jgi:hypothetical protein